MGLSVSLGLARLRDRPWNSSEVVLNLSLGTRSCEGEVPGIGTPRAVESQIGHFAAQLHEADKTLVVFARSRE